MNFRNVSTLGRPLEMNYPTNRAIAAISGAVIVILFLLQWTNAMPWLDALAWAFQAGISVFLAWAIGRELDPDHGFSAFVSSALMLGFLWFSPLPNLLALFWLMLLLRLLNRTVGLPATVIDLLSIMGLTIWLCWQVGWMYGLLATLVFLMDQFALGARYKMAWPLLVSLGIAIVFLFIYPSVERGDVSQWLWITGPLVLISFALTILTSEKPKSIGDATGEPLIEKRVKAAQWMATFVALVFIVLQGEMGIFNLLPLWTAMAGAALFMLWQHLEKHLADRRSH